MTHSLRVRRVMAALWVAVALTVAAATPMIIDAAGFCGTVSADECGSSSVSTSI